MADVEAKKSTLDRTGVRYAISVGGVAVALALRLILERSFGIDLPPFITFYPAIMFAAMLSGLGPGVLATFLSALVADYWFIPPHGSFAIDSTSNAIALVLFGAMGIFMSVVAASLRRKEHRIETLRRNAALGELRKQADEALHRHADMLRLSFDAIIVWELGGAIKSWNRGAEQLYGYSEEEALGRMTHELLRTTRFEPWPRVEAELRKSGNWEGELRHITKDGREVIVSARHQLLVSSDGVELILETNRDITQRKKAGEDLYKLNRTLRALSNSNVALLHASNETEFLQRVCNIVREDCGHAMVWIGIAKDNEGKDVIPVAHSGFEEGYLETLHITWSDSELGRGPTGTAIRTGQVSMCRNMLEDPAFLPWREEAIKHGYAASLVVPLMLEDKALGAITIYSREVEAFTKGEVSLLTELASGMSNGIATLRLRAAHAVAEQALRSSQAKLNSIVSSAMDAVVSIDERQRIVVFNRAAEMVFKCAESEAIGSTIDRFIPDTLREIHQEHVRQFAAEGVTARSMTSPGILTAMRSDGEIFPIEATISKVQSDGQSLYTVILRDITERMRAEQALRASERRWATTLKSIGDAVISTDANGRIEFMNDVAQKLTGWSLPEAYGEDLADVFNIVHEDTRMKPESPVAKVIRLNTVVGLTNHTSLLRRDGSETPIEDSAAPIRNKDGEVEGVVLVFHDVSEQRRAEKAMRLSDRLATTGRLAATIAHEIHNPLDAVSNLLFLIGQDSKEETTREYVAMASRELARITQMTQRMLAFQRESAKPVPVNVSEILSNVVELYERKISSAAITLKRQVDFNGVVLALPGELRQMFANFIGNAIEAVGSKQGRITVRACASRDWLRRRQGLRVTIADNGPGIPANLKARIFEPFFTTKGESGTGLGLWIASDILRKYDGTLRLRTSTKPGCSGTCFSVFLPFEAKREAAKLG